MPTMYAAYAVWGHLASNHIPLHALPALLLVTILLKKRARALLPPDRMHLGSMEACAMLAVCVSARSACRMGAEPQWAVSGESFPVGCRFHPAIACPQFFSVNPDRRRRMYSTDTGVYKEHCGLAAVHMSWSASEYLYMVRPSCGHHVCLPCAPLQALWISTCSLPSGPS